MSERLGTIRIVENEARNLDLLEDLLLPQR